MGSPGQDYAQALKDAGVSDEGVSQWQSNQRAALTDAGVTPQGVSDYFGDAPEIDPKPLQKFAQKNFEANPPKPADPNLPLEDQTIHNVKEAFQTGWQMSIEGLNQRHALADRIPQEHLPMAYRLAMTAAQLAGDSPTMIAGFLGGAAAGGAAAAPLAVVPGIGAAVVAGGAAAGGAAGAFALPAMVRKALMDDYTKGSIKSFEEFWSSAAPTLMEGAKGALTGLATAGAGAAAGIAADGLSPFLRGSAVAASEVAAMTTVGKTLEGKVPEPADFVEGALLVGALHGLGIAGKKALETKLKDTYAATGATPKDVVNQAMQDPQLMGDLLSSNKVIPDQLRPLQDPSLVPEGHELVPGQSDPVPMKDIPVAKDFSEENGGLPSPELKVSTQIEEAPKEEAPPEEAAKVPSEEVAPAAPETNADRIVYPKKEGIIAQTVAEAKNFWDNKVQLIFDRADPLKEPAAKLAGTAPPDSDNVYTLSRNMKNKSAGVIRSFFKDGPVKYATGEKVEGVMPLEKIGAMVEGNLKDLDLYMADQQALELAKQGKESGFDLEASKQNVKDRKGTAFEQAAIEMRKFRDATVDYLVDSGVFSEKTTKLMREANDFHVPFYRFLTDENGKALETGAGGEPIKKREGSTKEILSPINSIVNDTMRFVDLAERNRVLRSMVEQQEAALAENPDGEAVITRESKPIKATKVQAAEMSKALQNSGMDKEGADALASDFTVFRGKKTPLESNQMIVRRDGQSEIWSGDEDMIRALRDQDPTTRGIAMRMASAVAQFKRTGITGVLEFGLRHPFGDQIRAFINSGGQYTPFVDWAKGFMEIATDGKYNEEWNREGGAFSAVMDSEKVLSDNFQNYAVKSGYLASIKNILMTPVHLMEAINRASIDATKVGYFKKLSETNPEMPISERVLKSREVSTDFSARGNSETYRNLSTMKAFLNAELQGSYQTLKAFNADPVKATKLALISITAPTLANWFINKDDPKYADENASLRALAWVMPIGDTVYRIPKPVGVGQVFGSFPEMLLNALYQKNPGDRNHPFAVIPQVLQAPIPDIATPAIEQFFNHSFFTGNQIVPYTVEKQYPLPEYQSKEYTSETAKALSKIICDHLPWMKEHGPAPLYIENYIQGWGGTLGKYATQILDTSMIKSGMIEDPVKPDAQMADIPFVRAFAARWPTQGTQPIQDLYERMKVYDQHVTTIQNLLKSGNVGAAQAELDWSLNEGKYVKIQGAMKAFTNMQTAARGIWNAKDIKPYEKRQMLDGLTLQMNDAAKYYNSALDQIEAGQKAQ